MHTAHSRIGVFGCDALFSPYDQRRAMGFSDSAAAALSAALIGDPQDADAGMAVAMLESAARSRNGIACRRASFKSAQYDWANVDCFVVFDRGLRIGRHWSDLAGPPSAMPIHRNAEQTLRVEIAATAQWHPVLDDVYPFSVDQVRAQNICIPADADVLLHYRTPMHSYPLAWIEHGSYGEVFQSLLGSSADLQHPSFLRLALNAMEWIGRGCD